MQTPTIVATSKFNDMEIVRLKLSELELNAGQIEGLPVNPRQWSKSDIDTLAKSLTETPELFEARPIIVVPHKGKYVILGGNLRFEASRVNKAETVPAVIFPEATPIEKLKEIVIKDNGSFGQWDYDFLANEWDDLPLADWGVPAWTGGGSGVDINGLFNKDEAPSMKEKPLEVVVVIPKGLEDNEEDIRAAIVVTLEQFPGTYVK